jgi:hypothetical protein
MIKTKLRIKVKIRTPAGDVALAVEAEEAAEAVEVSQIGATTQAITPISSNSAAATAVAIIIGILRTVTIKTLRKQPKNGGTNTNLSLIIIARRTLSKSS